ncbi:MAG: SDR family NAD(P)-dependent oxidoreductase [Omnitrophica WOR_2 bacterium]
MKSSLFISGATGGLGSAFAAECAGRGFDLFLTDLRPEGEAFAHFLADKYNVDVQYRACDLTSPHARAELYDFVKVSPYRFWGLINVAGTDYEGAFLERSRQQILQILRLNVESTLDTTFSILRLRDQERRFRLINVCSLAAYFPMPYKAVYAASKRFLFDFSLALGEEIRPFGTVTALCPGGLPTTPETMRAIFAQGFWGLATTMDTRVVARRTVDQALKGKPVYIPGVVNRLVHGLGSLAPMSLAASFVGKRWKAVQNDPDVWPQRLSLEDLSINNASSCGES